jgi:AcrR family transcriptional regulator
MTARKTDGRRVRNRRGEGDRLRTELVEAASRLLETVEGEETLSLRAVTREVGAAPQSLYLHFADKRALMRAVYEARFGELLDRLRTAADDAARAAAPAKAPRARLAAICHAYCAYGTANPGPYRVLFGTAGVPGLGPDDMPGMDAFGLLRDAVAGCVPRARADRVTPAAVCVWAALHGMVTLRTTRPGFPWPPADDLIDLTVTAYVPAG